ncbi:MAG: class I SAM-dependent methyltransferase [Rhizobiaceae bacterium]|nr:class I SAM-dependent methyltransferase [Rhizobiaceae bacterium]
MTPLEQEIRQRIATDGPMPLAEYMVICLTHPEFGYYTTGHPVGGKASGENPAGDFITSPEISQMFGELIGVWCMEAWQALGSPLDFNLVEIGPGRGTLMKDLLQVTQVLPDFVAAKHVHLVEVSPTLRKAQKNILPTQANIKWIGDIDDLPNRPTLIIANELLDALPFRQWCKHGTDWLERAVGVVEEKLTFVLRPNRLELSELPPDHLAQPEGTLFETAPAREAFVARTADLIKSNTGAALFIDYGHLKSGYGDTFQAVRDHEHADPLQQLGNTDLTSHVDFGPLCAVANSTGCGVPQPVAQGQFLLSMGLLELAGRMGTGRPADVQSNLQQAVERLASPQGMGDLFKVMGFAAPTGLSERLSGFS